VYYKIQDFTFSLFVVILLSEGFYL